MEHESRVLQSLPVEGKGQSAYSPVCGCSSLLCGSAMLGGRASPGLHGAPCHSALAYRAQLCFAAQSH